MRKDEINDSNTSDEPWDETQELVFSAIVDLCDQYYYETGRLSLTFINIEHFPTCAMIIDEEDPSIRLVIMYEAINSMKDALTSTGYHGIIVVDFYNNYQEPVGIFMEKL